MSIRSLLLGRLHFHHTVLNWVGLWPLGVIAHRRRILFANLAAAQLLGGQRRSDLLGRDAGRVYRPEPYTPFSRPSVARLQLRRLDGSPVLCDVLAFHVPMLQRGLTLMLLCAASREEAEQRAPRVQIDRSQKNYLTNPKVSDSVFIVKNEVGVIPLETQQPMVGTKLIDLNPPLPDRARRSVQRVYMHHCAVCQGDWVGYDANPSYCNYCKSRRWRSGKTLWDERHEYDETVSDHPYDRWAVLDLMREAEEALSAFDVLRGLQLPHSRYDAVRRTLNRMLRDKLLVRVGRGRYVAATPSPGTQGSLNGKDAP